MGRKVRIRDSYTKDAIELRRLKDAVQMDEKRPKEWRDETADILEQAIRKLLAAP